MSKTRNEALKRAAHERDGFRCLRCLRGKDHGLEAHHVEALADGGADTLENVATLCSTCHSEWHRTLEGGRWSYEEFIRTPPLKFFAAFIKYVESDGDDEERAAAATIRKAWATYLKIMDLH